MLQIPKRLLLTAVIIIVFGSIIGCDRDSATNDVQGPQLTGDIGPKGETGEQGPQGEDGPAPKLNVLAMLEATNSANVNAKLTVSVFDTPSIPEVALDGVAIPIESDWWLGGSRMTWQKTVSIDGVDTAHLSISYTMADGTSGTAISALPIPAYPSVLDNPVSCTFGNDIRLEWNRTPNATAYYITNYTIYKYTDTTGTTRRNRQSFDTILAASDTLILIPAQEIYPDPAEVDSLIEFLGDYQIRALTGPWLNGELNNIAGDGYGVFVGTSYSKTVNFQLVGAPPSEVAPNRTNIDADDEFRRRVSELFGETEAVTQTRYFQK